MAPLALSALRNDSKLIQKFFDHEVIDKSITQIAIKNFQINCGFYRQNFLLWQFFYQNVSNSTKTQILEALKTDPLGYALELY